MSVYRSRQWLLCSDGERLTGRSQGSGIGLSSPSQQLPKFGTTTALESLEDMGHETLQVCTTGLTSNNNQFEVAATNSVHLLMEVP